MLAKFKMGADTNASRYGGRRAKWCSRQGATDHETSVGSGEIEAGAKAQGDDCSGTRDVAWVRVSGLCAGDHYLHHWRRVGGLLVSEHRQFGCADNKRSMCPGRIDVRLANYCMLSQPDPAKASDRTSLLHAVRQRRPVASGGSIGPRGGGAVYHAERNSLASRENDGVRLSGVEELILWQY